jgi:hypothetical protein
MVDRQINVVQEIDSGSVQEADTNYLEGLRYGLLQPTFTSPRPANSVTVFVPRQDSWPIYFGAGISAVPPPSLGQTTDFLIFTKDSPASTWRISFVIGDAATSDDLTLPPPAVDGQGYDTVTAVSGSSPTTWLGSLANYYRSWKDTGAAPSNSAFVSNSLTSGQGQQMAEHPQGYIGDDGEVVNHYEFTAPPSSEQWLIGIGGNPMVCGTDHETVLNTPHGNGRLYQTPNRQNWGPEVAPGFHAAISLDWGYPVCIYSGYNGPQMLGALGDLGTIFSQSGTPPS